jgi:2-oxoglutarate ferredoxin oxidoreductase subunit delta
MLKTDPKNRFGIEINREWCKACFICIRACRKKVLEKGSEPSGHGYVPPVAAHAEKCVGCRICELMCPDIAIRIQPLPHE